MLRGWEMTWGRGCVGIAGYSGAGADAGATPGAEANDTAFLGEGRRAPTPTRPRPAPPAAAPAGPISLATASSRSSAPLASWADAGGGAGDAGGGDGSWRSVVSPCGTAAMTSPLSVTMGRGGMTGGPRSASKASGAPAISDSFTFFQSSPERFSTMPHAWTSAPPFGPMTSRDEGPHTGD